MRIEKSDKNSDLAYNAIQYPIFEEIQEPNDVMLELEEMEMGVEALESVMAYDSFECLDKMRLSQEEEMLLDYLLPNRQARQTSIKGVPYSQFLRNSLKEYQLAQRNYRTTTSVQSQQSPV